MAKKRILAFFLATSLATTSLTGMNVQAAVLTASSDNSKTVSKKDYVKALAISEKNVQLTSGEKKVILVTVKVAGNATQKIKAKVSASGKKIVSVKVGKPNKQGLSRITITGNNVTTASTATINLSTVGKGKRKKLTKKIKVSVVPNVSETSNASSTAQTSSEPGSPDQPDTTNQPTVSEQPNTTNPSSVLSEPDTSEQPTVPSEPVVPYEPAPEEPATPDAPATTPDKPESVVSSAAVSKEIIAVGETAVITSVGNVLSYSSTNTGIVSVLPNGVVVGVSEGAASVTVMFESGEIVVLGINVQDDISGEQSTTWDTVTKDFNAKGSSDIFNDSANKTTIARICDVEGSIAYGTLMYEYAKLPDDFTTYNNLLTDVYRIDKKTGEAKKITDGFIGVIKSQYETRLAGAVQLGKQSSDNGFYLVVTFNIEGSDIKDIPNFRIEYLVSR